MTFGTTKLTFREEEDHHRKTLQWLIPQLAVILAVWFSASNDMNWYDSFGKPRFDMPEWFFGPIWMVLYGLMGVGSYLVWRQTSPWYSRTMTWYWTQLAVGTLWVLAFFEMHSPLLGFLLIVPLWILVAICVFAFSMRSRVASALLVPYFIWVSCGVTLNASIYYISR